MKTEYEAKFLNVEADKLRECLKEIGAELVHEERILKRRNYDFPDNRLDKENGWVRLRDEGNRITLAYKQLQERTITGTKEASIIVDSWDGASRFLSGIGLEQKTYQETKRESWIYDGAEVEIDTWPWIPTFVEIEAVDEKTVQRTAKKLDLDWSTALFGSVENVYAIYFDVTEQEVCGWKEILFTDVPDWLEIKRR